MSERYFCSPPIDSTVVRLTGAEAHHMLHVMRGRRGDHVRLFDGSGSEFEAQIDANGRDWVDLHIISTERIDRELDGELIIAVALPKGDRQRTLVEKLVELGVSALIPLAVERSVAHFTDAARERLIRYTIEASKQCGRNRLMTIEDAGDVRTYFAREDCPTKLVAHPGSSRLDITGWSRRIAVAIGPEGGFSNQELDAAIQCGWQTVGLGSRILRTETAAIYLAALASAHLDG